MVNKLKIGINGRFFTKPFSGIGRYSINLFTHLAKANQDLELIVVVDNYLDDAVKTKLQKLKNIKIKVIKDHFFLKLINKGLAKAFWEKFQMIAFLKKQKINILHLPYPALFTKIKNCPTIMTIHDTIPWTTNEYFQRNYLSKIYNQYTLKSALLVEQLITVSNESLKEIKKINGFNDKNIKVIYNANESDLDQEVLDLDIQKLSKKLNINLLKTKYLFYLGGFDQRKNVNRLVELYNQEIAGKSDIKLILGGDFLLRNSLFKKLNGVENKNIISTGFLNEKELRILYKLAWAYISLTKIEGFNLPLLEALSVGTPVFISDIHIHHEIGGDLPIFLDLHDNNVELAKKILTFHENKLEYNQLKSEIHQNIEKLNQQFSWKISAKKLYSLYQNIIKLK